MGKIRQQLLRQKMDRIWEQAQSDPEYARLFAQMAELERRYEAVMEQLPEEMEDVIRDYVSQCEAMSHRMLECACGEGL